MSVPVGLFVVMAALCVAHQGRLVELLYPALSLVIAIWLYRKYPAHYLGFICWLFFLTPEVRRLADFFVGAFNPVSPIMTAPLACAAISGCSLVINYKVLGERRAMPLLIVMLGLLYAYVIGVARAGFSAATFGMVSAVFPALVGFRLIVSWTEHPEYQRVLLKTFVYACILMGAYGVYEFINPPPWDAFWLLQSGMVNDGTPVPFGWRVAGTMNSSGPFANTLLVCIVMALAGKGKLRIAASIALPALMFTSVRSAWGGLLLGLIYPIAMLDGRSRMRLIAAVITCVALCAPLAMFGVASDQFASRLGTIQNLDQDNSFQMRVSMYSAFFARALSDVSGQGFGGTGVASKLSDDQADTIMVFDSGLMEVPYVMGWPGTLLYVSGMFALLWRAFAASRKQSKDHFSASGVGVAIATMMMMVFANTLTGVTGMFFFIGVLMPVNGLRYARLKGAAAQPKAARSEGGAAALQPQPHGIRDVARSAENSGAVS